MHSPVFTDCFLQAGEGACGAVLIRGLNDGIADHAPCEKCRSDGAETKVLPMDLLSKEEVGVIRFGISQIGLGITEKKGERDYQRL